MYTYPADLSGTPTITLSMQIAGQPLSEPTCAGSVDAYEEATGWYKKHPNV